MKVNSDTVMVKIAIARAKAMVSVNQTASLSRVEACVKARIGAVLVTAF